MLRWATYGNMQFEEGVSLSAIDELARWSKYSYGCSYVFFPFVKLWYERLMGSEIIFNPMRYWFTRGGPFTKLFRTFLWSPIPAHAKWSIMAYTFSYYALALSWSLSLLNFALIGSLGKSRLCHISHKRMELTISLPGYILRVLMASVLRLPTLILRSQQYRYLYSEVPTEAGRSRQNCPSAIQMDP